MQPSAPGRGRGHTLAAALFLAAAALSALADASPAAAQAPLSPERQLARDIYKELIEINTTDSAGSSTDAANAVAARLRAAGFPSADVQVLVPAGNARRGNLVARMRAAPGSTLRPILLLAHLDVVEAKKEDWSSDIDPFRLTEKDGFFYGRGTTDDKAMAAIWVATLIRFRREGFVPDRDIVLALTADEEGGDFNGVKWLLENHRDLLDVDFGLNEGGGGELRQGRHIANKVGTAEKVYLDFNLQVTNAGGHSSIPRRDNAIYHLAQGLARLADFSFEAQTNETTRAFFERMGTIEGGSMGADMRATAAGDTAAMARLSANPVYNALLRTTCVATMLSGGHANNALPQRASAIVNCRLFPGARAQDVQATLVRVLADTAIAVSPVAAPKPSPPSPLRPDVFGPIERITAAMWPGTPVVPVMGTGATDGLYFRQRGIPVYGVDGLFEEVGDGHAHGRDERMSVPAFYEGEDFLYRLVKAYSTPRT